MFREFEPMAQYELERQTMPEADNSGLSFEILHDAGYLLNLELLSCPSNSVDVGMQILLVLREDFTYEVDSSLGWETVYASAGTWRILDETTLELDEEHKEKNRHRLDFECSTV